MLVPTGTLWIECGDSYASTRGMGTKRDTSRIAGVKPKDLIGSPFLLAFGLRDDGWWWRSVNIWHKPNCLPESVTDRPVVQHSYVMQFSKRARYFHDAEAVREPAEWARWGDQTVVKEQQGKGAWIEAKGKNELPRSTPQQDRRVWGFNARWDAAEQNGTAPTSRALRSVWTIPTEGFPEAHFATWPTKLAERILLQACPEAVCRVCGKARERITSTEYENPGNRRTNGKRDGEFADRTVKVMSGGQRLEKRVTTEGFTDCGHDSYRPGIVLDPFGGSGTTALAARKLGRHAVLVELNPEYCEMAARRLAQQSLAVGA